MNPQHTIPRMKNSIHPTSRPGFRRRGILPAAATATLALCQLNATAQNLIQNGSFEDPVVGSYALYTTGQTIGNAWLVESASPYLDLVGSWGTTQPPGIFYPTPAGDQFCYLADGVRYSVLRQDIATPLAAGVTYELKFLQATFHPRSGQVDGKVTAELAPAAGAPELTRVFSLSDYTDWTEQSLLFTPAVSGPYTLRFSSIPGVPGNIDDVRLAEAAVPEPAACGLAAGLGLLGLAGWQRGRRRISPAAGMAHLPWSLTAAVALWAVPFLVQPGVRGQSLDPWSTTDDFQAIEGQNARGGAIGTDATGTIIFSAGQAVTGPDGTASAVINRSTDAGATWIVVDQFSFLAGASGAYGAFAADHGTGSLYAGGGISDGTAGHWIVRRSDDIGSNWQTVDDFQYAPGKASACTDLAADGRGVVYAVGRATQANGATGTWIVRKSVNGGDWNTVDLQPGVNSGAGAYLGAMAVAVHPNGSVFVVGAQLRHGQSVWTVRRSTNQGATWTTVDATSPKEGSARAEAIAVDSTGIIYAAGYVNSFWVVRKSTSAGDSGTWVTAEKAMLYAAARGITTVRRTDNLPDDVFVAGWALAKPSNIGTWVVRKAEAGGNSFAFSDEYLLVPGQAAAADAITRDEAGNLYATGYGRDATATHWITRKLKLSVP